MPSIRRLPRPVAAGTLPALLALAVLTAACDENFADPELIDAEGSRLVVVSGNNQSGALGAVLPQPLRVQVLDERGNPAPQQRVEFRQVIGAGLFSSLTAVTDFAGFTQVRYVPLTAGDLVVEAGRPGGAGVTFFLAAIDSSQVRNPASFQKAGGDGQTGTVGTILPQPLTVRVLNADGNPIERLPVVFTATTDGTLLLTARDGDFTRQDSLGNSPVGPDSVGLQVVSFTNENGVAAALVRLATEPGTNTVTASSTAEEGASTPVVFTATGVLGPISAADSLFPISGSGQIVHVDTTLTDETQFFLTFNPMIVQVTDRFGNPIAGVEVFFRVSVGLGSLDVAAGAGACSALDVSVCVVTDEAGVAGVTYTSFPGSSGDVVVTANVPSIGTVAFTAQIIFEGTPPPQEEEGGGG